MYVGAYLSPRYLRRRSTISRLVFGGRYCANTLFARLHVLPPLYVSNRHLGGLLCGDYYCMSTYTSPNYIPTLTRREEYGTFEACLPNLVRASGNRDMAISSPLFSGYLPPRLPRAWRPVTRPSAPHRPPPLLLPMNCYNQSHVYSVSVTVFANTIPCL